MFKAKMEHILNAQSHPVKYKTPSHAHNYSEHFCHARSFSSHLPGPSFKLLPPCVQPQVLLCEKGRIFLSAGKNHQKILGAQLVSWQEGCSGGSFFLESKPEQTGQ